MRLANKIALITGAAGDIGRATALRFAAEGAQLILTDINEQGAQQTLGALGEAATFVRADLTSEADITALFQHAVRDFGRLDILVNIAGGDYDPMIGFDEMTFEGIERNLRINLTSCMLCCREASKIMMEQASGKIVNMCSICYRGAPTPMQQSYAASKGGIFAFTRGLAMNLGMYTINVNAVAPSLVEVAAIKDAVGQEMWEAISTDAAGRYPLGRVARPEDVANCILFLASAEADFITGQVIEVSGGARL
jgi:NAD(P)-dependent dehydrogenase (short-subunit alcohol dehydrogenase family)